MDKLVHEDKPQFSLLLRIIVWFTIAIVLFMALVTLNNGDEDAYTMVGTAIFIVLVFWAVIPRKYCIYEDKIKVELGKPFSLTVRFDNIKYAGKPRGKFTVGINFVTSFRNTVEIDPKKGMNVNITPGNREVFLDSLNGALERWREEHPAI